MSRTSVPTFLDHCILSLQFGDSNVSVWEIHIHSLPQNFFFFSLWTSFIGFFSLFILCSIFCSNFWKKKILTSNSFLKHFILALFLKFLFFSQELLLLLWLASFLSSLFVFHWCNILPYFSGDAYLFLLVPWLPAPFWLLSVVP